jgi:hypothetical protein
MKVYPFDDVVESLLKKRMDGWEYCLQFNCAKCGAKQTIETPNTLFKLGQCEECKHVTDLQKAGLNYMLYRSSHKLADILKATKKS